MGTYPREELIQGGGLTLNLIFPKSEFRNDHFCMCQSHRGLRRILSLLENLHINKITINYILIY